MTVEVNVAADRHINSFLFLGATSRLSHSVGCFFHNHELFKLYFIDLIKYKPNISHYEIWPEIFSLLIYMITHGNPAPVPIEYILTTVAITILGMHVTMVVWFLVGTGHDPEDYIVKPVAEPVD